MTNENLSIKKVLTLLNEMNFTTTREELDYALQYLGIINQLNEPTLCAVDCEYMEVTREIIKTPFGGMVAIREYITPKGLKAIIGYYERERENG